MSQLQETDRGVSLRPAPGEMPGHGAQQQPHRQPQVAQHTAVSRQPSAVSCGKLIKLITSIHVLPFFPRLASNNNLSKSESDQEDNDDLNDNDWSYGAEKKGLCLRMSE